MVRFHPGPLIMDKCLICKKTNGYPICKTCSKKPFLVERARQILASFDDLDTLKNTYNAKYSEIRDINTSSFWNKKVLEFPSFEDQDGMTKDRIRTVFRFLPRAAKKVLDIGAGSGLIEELISKKNIKVYGNDISSIAVRKLKERFEGSFKKESLHKMKYPKRSFDAVFLLEVLEHVSPSKTLTVLKKIKEILKKSGSLILSIPTNEGLEKTKKNLSAHVRTYTENLIRAELKIAGFRVVKLKTLYAFKNFYTIKKISSKILRNRWEPNNMVILARAL